MPDIARGLVGKATAEPFSEPPIIPGEPGAASTFALHREVRRFRKSRERDSDYQRLILKSAALLAEALITIESSPSVEAKQRMAGGIREHFRAHQKLFRDLARAGIEVHPLVSQMLVFFGGDDDDER